MKIKDETIQKKTIQLSKGDIQEAVKEWIENQRTREHIQSK